MPERLDDVARGIEDEAAGLVGLFLAWTGDRNVADDLAQETCLEAWKSRERFREGHGLGAWMRGIAQNVLHRHWRRGRRAASVPLTPEVVELLAATWAETEKSDPATLRKEALGRCLEGLEPQQREVLSRRYEQEWSHEQLAADAGRTPDAMKMVLSRLRSKLHDCVEKRLARGLPHA